MIDGPQGSGKTSAVYKLREMYPDAIYRKFDSKVYMQDYLHDDYKRSQNGENFIYERGMLSYAIYGMLWNSEQSIVNFKIDWLPVKRCDFQEMIQLIDHTYIVYASNGQDLIDSIHRRTAETGRVLPTMEYEVVLESNMLFPGYGEMLKSYAPEKVTLIDFSKNYPSDVISNESL